MKQLIKKPIISEKSFSQSASGKFTFLADPSISKEDAKSLVEELYKVNVLKINSTNYSGKIKRAKGKKGKRDDYKKMVLTLKPGQKIDLFEVETEDKNTAKKDKKAGKKTAVKESKDVTVKVKSPKEKKEK